jgi:ankyrin repeat protein
MASGLLDAVEVGDLPRVQWLLSKHPASIAETDILGRTALLLSAYNGMLPMCQWLLSKGATITETDILGYTPLLSAAIKANMPENLTTVKWLLEFGGASIAETTNSQRTCWDLLSLCDFWRTCDTAAVTALLQVMLLRGAPPLSMASQLSPDYRRVVEEGARLRARLPAYLARRRRVRLSAHCPLLGPLRTLALVRANHQPTTKQIWATGLGADVNMPRVVPGIASSPSGPTLVHPPSRNQHRRKTWRPKDTARIPAAAAHDSRDVRGTSRRGTSGTAVMPAIAVKGA